MTAGADIAGWDGTVAGARALQDRLAPEVVLRDGFAKPLRVVAGLGCSDGGGVIRAGAVLLDAVTQEVLAMHATSAVAAMPAVPGLRSFRVLPALLRALDGLPQRPDLVFVAGHGIAHPHRLGVASHFGLAADLPTIGVATEISLGTGPTPHDIRGAYTALRDAGHQIGWLLRSHPHCPPLAVSPGHRVALASAADLVMRFVARDRLPEPIRLAEDMAQQQE